jgi:hypothetical protein
MSGACSDELQCLCSACALPCANDADCSALAAGALCVQREARSLEHACSETAVEGSCELPCSSDADCATLGPDHRCDSGYCRGLASDCVTGEIAASEVAVLGDNFFAVSDAFVLELERLARSSGALQDQERYRNYSSALVGPFGGGNDLSTQYSTAVAEGTPRVIVLDIGGPDALLPCPSPPAADCPALANAATGAEQLLAQMGSDGVEAVVVLFYPTPQDAELAAKFDVLRPMVQGACFNSAVPCHFLDLRPTFEGRADYLDAEGVLPTDSGAVATANAVWGVMRKRCIAQ